VQTRLTLVVAPRNGGKTTHLVHLIETLKQDGLDVAGVLALANPEKTWYRLKDLSSTESRLVLCETQLLGMQRIGRFSINAEGFAWANALIEKSLGAADVVVFDEIGKLELGEGGLAPSFRKALALNAVSILASVRDEHVQEVVKHFSLDASELTLVPVKKDDIENE
jgi:nucleoside-triphosphatase THEP1